MAATDVRPLLDLTHRFADELPELCMPWQGAEVADPQVVAVDEALAEQLGLDPDTLSTPEAADWSRAASE